MKDKLNTNDSIPEPAEIAEIKETVKENIIKTEEKIDEVKEQISQQNQEISKIISGEPVVEQK